MKEYNHKEIESKWQKYWEEKKYGIAEDFSDKPKHYNLIEFPYPSGSGLHVGHCMAQGASDAYCRMKRMQGFNVMYPIGWDAFGLPTENFAIKNKLKPQKVAADAIATFTRQIKSLGYSFDWSREVNTTDPDYYKWTQWIFLQFYKHAIVDDKLVEVADADKTTPRLAFQAEMPVNWCPSCKIVLANEEVVDGKCERCGAQAEKRNQKQWMLRITAYADRLIKDLDTVDYLEKIKTQQINWIGKSEGAKIEFQVVIPAPDQVEGKTPAGIQENKELDPRVKPEDDTILLDGKTIEVFTTRPDTLFGCTYIVVAPDGNYISKLKSQISNLKEVEDYIENAKKKSDLERTELQKIKTGVELKGIKAINPINDEEVSVWVADYCLANYGTGAVMAVPAHDQRDFEFASKYDIPIKQVIAPYYSTTAGPDAINSGKETVTRHAVIGLVKHWKEDKYYLLDWEKFGWKSMVIGGVEDGETGEKAIKREVREETGYQSIKSVRKIGFESINHFFARHKDVNRYGFFNCYLVELDSDEFIEPKEEDVKNHKGHWIEGNKVRKYITFENHLYFWDIYKNGESAFSDYGVLINSGEFDGLTSEEAKKAVTRKLKENGSGDFTTNFKLRDWIFSRQHYWGEPIPIIHCDKCGDVPVPEDQLPVTLPNVENYEPTDTGESPLAKMTEWVNTTCPKCGDKAKRETDTMPNWAGSSWYFLRYCDSKNSTQFASMDKLKYWTPVDLYNGGMEHTTLHLLYSRFWHKFLFDLGVVPTAEPYEKRIAHGIILGPDGRKMSKSYGNVINPDDIVETYGADTLRMYIAFIGPYDQESAWNTAGVHGISRFLKRVWINQDKVTGKSDDKAILIKLNQTIMSVSQDLEGFHLNTAVSKLMEFNNILEKVGHISKEEYLKFLQILFPLAPHIASEIAKDIFPEIALENSKWPEVDSAYLIAEKMEIPIQINGKLRSKMIVNSGISDDDMKELALKDEKVREQSEGKEIAKVIVVPQKLVSIVIR